METVNSAGNVKIPTVSIVASECHQAETAGGDSAPRLVNRQLIGNGPAVYLLMCDAVGRVKIGYTRNMANRWHRLGDDSPFPIRLIAMIHTPYFRELEARIHQDLAHRRVHGEWFDLTEVEALAYLEENGIHDGADLSKFAVIHCNQCGEPMTGARGKLYCSDSCRQKNYRSRKQGLLPSGIAPPVSSTTAKRNVTAIATCQQCGREMVVKRPSKRFCGAACRRAAWLVRNPEKAAALAISDKARLRDHLASRGIAWVEITT
ncbi:MAG: GIY-YIG nuclease family protein [Anaerolineae bacterium]|nr:GIY-YIG nuclease family protein [Anaerolineae bacterium]